MPSLQKELMLKELMTAIESKNYMFFAQFNGISVADFGELRRKLEPVAGRALVVKNTLTRRAFQQLGVTDVFDFIKGAVLLTVGEREPQQVSKILIDFSKDRDGFKVGGGRVDGQLFWPKDVEVLAKLPGRQVLLTRVACSLNSPVVGFVSVLNQLVQSLAIALDQIQKKKAAQPA